MFLLQACSLFGRPRLQIKRDLIFPKGSKNKKRQKVPLNNYRKKYLKKYLHRKKKKKKTSIQVFARSLLN